MKECYAISFAESPPIQSIWGYGSLGQTIEHRFIETKPNGFKEHIFLLNK